MPYSYNWLLPRMKDPCTFVAKKSRMETEKFIKDDIIKRAEMLLYYNNLLIEQCESWLPAEEGNRNMEKRIREKKKNYTAEIMNNEQ